MFLINNLIFWSVILISFQSINAMEDKDMPNPRNKKSRMQVLEAIKLKEYEEIRGLMKEDKPMAARQFFVYVIQGNIDKLTFMLDAGMDINIRGDKSGLSAIILAAVCGQMEAIKFLVARGKSTTEDIHMACCLAAKMGFDDVVAVLRPEIMRVLAEEDSDIHIIYNPRDPWQKGSIIFY